MKYIFDGMAAKDITVVEASNEENARHEAMKKRWGVNPWYPKWIGKGLILIKKE